MLERSNLRYVGQTEWHSMQLLHSGHKAAVLGQGLVNELSQTHGAVITRYIETFLAIVVGSPMIDIL